MQDFLKYKKGKLLSFVYKLKWFEKKNKNNTMIKKQTLILNFYELIQKKYDQQKEDYLSFKI